MHPVGGQHGLEVERIAEGRFWLRVVVPNTEAGKPSDCQRQLLFNREQGPNEKTENDCLNDPFKL
jgi:hypothetical protein